MSVVGVAPHFEVLRLRIMLFLVPTFFLVYSICALYDNVRSSVTPRYTGRLQCVKVRILLDHFFGPQFYFYSIIMFFGV